MQAVSKKTQQIINDLSKDFSNRYIGRSLGLSSPTVKKYIDEES